MSYRATSWAWSQKGLRSSEKLVLLCLADVSSHDGVAFPSQAFVAQETALHVDTVMKCLKALSTAGPDREALIIDTGKRRGRTGQVIVWRLNGDFGGGSEKNPENRGLSDSALDDTDNSLEFQDVGSDPQGRDSNDPRNRGVSDESP